jgi:hypothetical protein
LKREKRASRRTRLNFGGQRHEACLSLAGDFNPNSVARAGPAVLDKHPLQGMGYLHHSAGDVKGKIPKTGNFFHISFSIKRVQDNRRWPTFLKGEDYG